MQDKYSLAKCEQYGRRLAARLCDQHFMSQPGAMLDGPAVLKFTSVRQLNLLVVHQLMGQWQGEIARLRSPYFDFEAVPVQTALTQFMNVLSRHIHIGRSSFEPLLAHAAADTLLIVADPIGTFERLLLGDSAQPTVAELRERLRYLDVDKEFFQGFIDSLPASPDASREFLLHRFELYHAANYKAHQPMQRLVAMLSALLPLTEADLREDGPVAPPTTAPKATVPEIQPEPSPSQTSIPTSAAPVAPQPAPVLPLVSAPTFAEPIPAQLPEQQPDALPLHEKLKASQHSGTALAETLRASATPFTERSAPKVETLREAISINQRFSFINELFNGENMEYHATIQHLDALPSAEQARLYVTTDLAARYDWSRKEEHVNKLLKLIERKFA